MFFIDGTSVVALAPATNTMSGATFHPLVIMLLMSGWYCVVFLSRVFCGELVIAICKLYELYGDSGCRGLWWGVVI